MKLVSLLIGLASFPVFGQNIDLKELPNPATRTSIFQPVSKTSPDGIEALRAKGAYQWNIAPIIGVSWDGSDKSLAMAIEVVGDNLSPSSAVFVIDGKVFTAQSSDWQKDRRNNLVAFFDKPGLVRDLAEATDVIISVYAPAPVTATFKSSDLSMFRRVVKAFDNNEMVLAEGNTKTVPPALITPPALQLKQEENVGRMKVTIIAKEPSATDYAWEINGRFSATCNWNTCSGYYTLPSSGTQRVHGAILRLQRPDGSIAIAECISKVNVMASLSVALDAMNAGDPNSPTVYRDCRLPLAGTLADADFRHGNVKLSWRYPNDRHTESETYSVLGILHPTKDR